MLRDRLAAAIIVVRGTLIGYKTALCSTKSCLQAMVPADLAYLLSAARVTMPTAGHWRSHAWLSSEESVVAPGTRRSELSGASMDVPGVELKLICM